MIALALLLSCSGDTPPDGALEPEADEPAKSVDAKPNVVVVTLDTTRADRLGVYGHEAAKTETIDAIAARGLRFDRAFSPVPLTIPAHATLFTGKEPHNHGVRNNGSGALEAKQLTLAEVLKNNGYVTAASVAAYVTTDLWGFDQGFDAYFDDIEASLLARRSIWSLERSANLVVDDAIGWLESEERDTDAPFFLWVHVYDPHHPLRPPEGYTEGDPYDGEIAFVDDQLARIEAKLAELGSADDTVWVIVGDHGEGHGEHVETTHGLFVYNNTQRVPFILAGPGIEPGVVDQPVGLVDVMPTLLHFLDIDAPKGMDGLPQPGGEHPIYMESYQLQERMDYAPHVAIVDGDRKLINTPRPELYDVNDVDELNDLAAEESDRVLVMQARLDALGVTPPTGETNLDAETLSRLAALGYVGGSGDMRTDAVLPDPKDKLDVIEALQRASGLAADGKVEEAIPILEKVAADEPTLAEARDRLSRLNSRKGDKEAAAYWIEEAVKLRPDNPHTLVGAIIMHARNGNSERALELANHGLRLDPRAEEFAEFKLMQLDRLGRTTEAVVFGEEFIAANPKATSVAGVLGVFYGRVEDMEKAEPLLRLSLTAQNPPRWVNFTMAVLASGSGHPDEAVEHLRAELHEYPDNRDARILLVKVLSNEGRYPEALPVVEVMLKVRPEDIQLLLTLAQLHYNMEQFDECEAALARVAVLDAEEPEYLLLKANLLNKQGKLEEATATFEAAKASKAARAPAPEPPNSEPSVGTEATEQETPTAPEGAPASPE